jgi:hypothetical protein
MQARGYRVLLSPSTYTLSPRAYVFDLKQAKMVWRSRGKLAELNGEAKKNEKPQRAIGTMHS